MKQEDLINQTLILTKTGERLKVIAVEYGDPETFIIKLTNKQKFRVLAAFSLGTLRFENESLNQFFQKLSLEKKEEEERRQWEKEEPIRQYEALRRQEQEMLDNAISSFRDEYRFLSNFYPVTISYNNNTYQNAEAAFQAQKDLSRCSEFTTLTPSKARSLGRKVELRKDWDKVKLGIMEDIVRLKFTKNADLRRQLLDTGDRLLIEGNSWHDKFWGKYNGRGENHLGKILMKVRDELRPKA